MHGGTASLDTTIAWATEEFSSSTSVYQATMLTYQVSNGALLKTFTPAISQIDEIAYANDGKTLVVVGENNVININYTDDLGTGVNSFALNEELDLITVTQMDSTISALSYSGI